MMRPPAVLGLGTATFLESYGIDAGPPPGDALITAAHAAGVTYYDTAAAYGDGEAVLGRTQHPGARVCTKIHPGGTIADVRASIDRLGAPADTILMHSASRVQLASAPAIGALEEAKSCGLTASIGASTYGTGDAAFALAQGWVDAVQIEYSILNQSVVRHLESAPVRRPGQEVIARSVLCKGLLTSRRIGVPELAATVGDALAAIERCARDWNHTIETLAIRFALDTPGIDVVLVGVSSSQELDLAIAAARREPLTASQWQALAELDRSDAAAAHPERWNAVRA